MKKQKEKENTELILKYIDAMNGKTKEASVCDQYMTDQKLKEHVLFFDAIFPQYDGEVEEIMAEGDRVMIRARMRGVHKGEFNGIPATYKKVEFPFVITYTIRNGKIVDHWLIADQMELLQQLGVIESNVDQNHLL